VVWASVSDISGETKWGSILRDVEVVIHCASHVPAAGERPGLGEDSFQRVNVQGTQALATQAAQAGVRRFVYLSSIKVHGEFSQPGVSFSEQSPFAPVDSYGRSKVAAESILRRISMTTSMECVILRPPLVYGSAIKGNLAALVRWIRRGLPLPFGAVHGNRRSLIAVDNLVDAIWHAAFHPSAARQTFVVSDGEDLSTSALLCALGQVVGRPARLVPVSPVLLRATAALAGQSAAAMRLLDSLQVDSSRIRGSLGWHPPLTVEEGLRRIEVPQ
jgi:nucleoside-diphosphate-sugar epimerase